MDLATVSVFACWRSTLATVVSMVLREYESGSESVRLGVGCARVREWEREYESARAVQFWFLN